MKNLVVYLSFPGTCQEALNFYKESIGGEIVSMQTMGDSPVPVADEHKSRIMHAEFKSDDIFFMASDGMPDQPPAPGANVSLSINFTDEHEQGKVFNNLASGGKITMALQDTFWNAKFGMLTDKYGINWMVNYDKPKS